jgi:Domain of unknown function (DUF1942)
MSTTTIASAAFAPLSVAAITIATAATAVAASPTEGGFGTREQLFDEGGAVVTGWTITDFRPSGDVIAYPVAGKLYEATAAVEADQGTVTPMVPNFNARATDGETYRALYTVATPQGVNPSALPQGAKSTGKIYFDVIGAVPNSVVYNDGSQDLLIWTGNASAPAATPAPAPAAPPAPAPAAAPAPAPAAAPAPAPAGAPAPAPAPAAAPAATPAASGSLPSGTSPSGGSTTGVSGISAGTAGTGGNPAAGSTTGVTGTNMGATAGAGGNPAGKT